MPAQTIAAIEQEIASLEREKAAIDSAIEGLKEARERLNALPLRSGQANPTVPVETARKEPVAPQQTHPERVVAFLNSCGDVPQTLDEIVAGTGLGRYSVMRSLYRTHPEWFVREKVAGKGTTWKVNTRGVATSHRSGPPKPPVGSAEASQFETVIAILKEAGRPLTATEIASVMIQRGAKTSLNSLRDTVHAVIRRKKQPFRKTKQGGRALFSLREWDAGKSTKAGQGGEAHGETQKEGAGRPENPPPTGGKMPLDGLTVEDAARIILTERDNAPTHYKEIAEEAEARGYTSGRSEKVRPETFAVMLARKDAVFEKVGGGRFRLVGGL